MSIFSELKRRNVYKVAVAYAVVGWLVIQVTATIVPALHLPDGLTTAIVVVTLLGFPIALVIAWAFEMTPEGLKRTGNLSPNEHIPQWSRRKFIAFVLVVGFVAAVLMGLQLLRPKGASPPPAQSRSIAVLPFENLSENKENAYFTDGIQDEVITRLAKIGELRVISRASTRRYRTQPSNLGEIARELGVSHLVEGTVQRAGDRVRINVQLIRAANEDHLWAEIYDRNLTDIFAVQTELATAIAQSLQATLTGAERKAVAEKPTTNLDAYDAYLRGIDLFSRPGQTEENQRKAAESFAKAVRLDPQFAQAWAALSQADAAIFFLDYDRSSARRESSRAAAEMATKLNSSSLETLLANAYYRYHVVRDYDGARVLFEKFT